MPSMLFARKLRFVFNAGHLALNYSYPFYAYDAGTLLAVLFVGPWLLLPLGLVGLAIGIPPGARPGAARRRPPPKAAKRTEYLIWLSFVPLYAVSVAAFFVTERYRLPLLVPMCIGAGAALDRVFRLTAAARAAAVKKAASDNSRSGVPELCRGIARLPRALGGRHRDPGSARARAVRQSADEGGRWARGGTDAHGGSDGGAGPRRGRGGVAEEGGDRLAQSRRPAFPYRPSAARAWQARRRAGAFRTRAAARSRIGHRRVRERTGAGRGEALQGGDRAPRGGAPRRSAAQPGGLRARARPCRRRRSRRGAADPAGDPSGEPRGRGKLERARRARAAAAVPFAGDGVFQRGDRGRGRGRRSPIRTWARRSR